MHPDDDRGLSLIELLVAVAILGIISIPMLQGFIVTHRATMQAGQLQGATLVAENLMETLHAHTVEEVRSRFGVGEETDGHLFLDVTEVTQGGIPYDARIDLTLPDAKDAVSFSSPAAYDAEQDILYRAADAAGNERRTIRVSINGTKDAVQVRCVTLIGEKEEAVLERTLSAQEELRNFFLLYTPDYRSTQSTYDEADTTYKDTIEFQNPAGIPVRFILIRQKTSGMTTQAIANSERSYRVRLLTENMQGTTQEVLTNLNFNIGAAKGADGAYTEKLVHQTLHDADVTLLPLQGTSLSAGSFYPATVTVYPAGAADEGFPDEMRIATLSNTGGAK